MQLLGKTAPESSLELDRTFPSWRGHIAGGSLGAAAGAVCLVYSEYGWRAFILAVTALNLWPLPV
jgi:hypothetical protein